MTHIYAIGDIHGQRRLLGMALALIEADMATHGPAPTVSLGDLVDRGPDSRGVIDDLMTLQAERDGTAAPLVVLKGNHDRMFEWFLRDPSRDDPRLFHELDWIHERLGGQTTLASYGVGDALTRSRVLVWEEARDAVPEAHRNWLAGLPLTHRASAEGPLLFVHAGLRPGVPLMEQDETDLLWIRKEWEADDTPLPWLVVHGHTALRRATHFGRRVDIDSGAGHGGPLTAVVFAEDGAFTLTPRGRVPLRPQ